MRCAFLVALAGLVSCSCANRLDLNVNSEKLMQERIRRDTEQRIDEGLRADDWDTYSFAVLDAIQLHADRRPTLIRGVLLTDDCEKRIAESRGVAVGTHSIHLALFRREVARMAANYSCADIVATLVTYYWGSMDGLRLMSEDEAIRAVVISQISPVDDEAQTRYEIRHRHTENDLLLVEWRRISSALDASHGELVLKRHAIGGEDIWFPILLDERGLS